MTLGEVARLVIQEANGLWDLDTQVSRGHDEWHSFVEAQVQANT